MNRQLDRVAQWASSVGTRSPFGLVLQTGRSLLAAGTLLTLLTNGSDVLFHTPGGGDNPNCAQAGRFGLYCIFGAENLELARWLSIGACALAILGVMPALSSALYWIAAISLFANAKPIDGGDQLTAILAFLLMLASVFDWRLFAWRRSNVAGRRFIAARVILLFIPLQMGYLYLNSAVGKFSVPIWADGSALWYWVQHTGFNAAPFTASVAWTVFQIPAVSAIATWGVLALELFLAWGIVVARRRRTRFLVCALGVAFHLGIALVMGLISFAIAMIAGLVLAVIRPGDLAAWATAPRSRSSPFPFSSPRVSTVAQEVEQ